MILPELKEIEEKKLVGQKIVTSFGDDKTVDLWSSFMPRRTEIRKRLNENFISLQHYPTDFDFQPQTPFTKWAVVEVEDFEFVPDGMESLVLPEGLYATYTHVGNAFKFRENLEFIYGKWIPETGHEIDDRPHFEVLGKNYKGPNDPSSEEEVWIPVRLKP